MNHQNLDDYALPENNNSFKQYCNLDYGMGPNELNNNLLNNSSAYHYDQREQDFQHYFDQNNHSINNENSNNDLENVSIMSSPPYLTTDLNLDLNSQSNNFLNSHFSSTQQDLLLQQQMSHLNINNRNILEQQNPFGVVATATAVANANTSFSTQSSLQIANPLNFTSAPSRTVYLGNIPPNVTVKELLDHVRSGVVEEIKILPEKMCAFISFIDESAALLFHSDAILKRLNIDGRDIKIGWGKPTKIDPLVASKIAMDGATRNVYIGHLNEEPIVDDEKTLREDLSQFGEIDSIKLVKEKGIAFIHFSSIFIAISVVTNLPNIDSKYSKKRVFYGKDRCAFITKTQQHNAAQFLGVQSGVDKLVQFTDREFISNALLQQSAAAAAIATSAGGPNNLGNRTIYLGNLPKDIKVEEICNVVRGGLLQNIKLLSDRFVCFVTFIDPTAAAQFYAMSSLHGLTIQKKRCKVGWGKHSGPLPNALALAVSNGASRNIYIGNIDMNDSNFFKEDNLREIFKQYGEVEQINFLPERKCCFVNFTNINNAILCLDKIKSQPEFNNLKINFGKDRCGNVPHQVR